MSDDPNSREGFSTSVPDRHRPNHPVRVAVAIVAVLALLLCGMAAVVVKLALRPEPPPDPPPPNPAMAGAPTRLMWAADGLYAVAQVVDSEAVPVVLVWDRVRDETRTLSGYLLAEVEPAAPYVWLVRCPGPAVEAIWRTDEYGENGEYEQRSILSPYGEDVRPDDGALERWRLDQPDPPVGAGADRSWDAWQAPHGGMVARLVVSAEDGAAPTSISFTARGGTVTASLPEDFFPDTPIRPIGWSPSGRYFAVVALTMDRDMLIFSASDGTVASRLALNLALPYCTNDDAPCVAAWDAREDVVHFLVRDMRSDGATQLMVAGPDVPVIEAARHFGWTDRPALSTGDQEALAGRGPGGPVLLTGLAGYFNEGGQVVEATPLDPAGSAVTYDLGASRMLAGVMAPQGDLFAVLQDEGGERQLVLFSPDGAKQRDLWSGP